MSGGCEEMTTIFSSHHWLTYPRSLHSYSLPFLVKEAERECCDDLFWSAISFKEREVLCGSHILGDRSSSGMRCNAMCWLLSYIIVRRRGRRIVLIFVVSFRPRKPQLHRDEYSNNLIRQMSVCMYGVFVHAGNILLTFFLKSISSQDGTSAFA